MRLLVKVLFICCCLSSKHAYAELEPICLIGQNSYTLEHCEILSKIAWSTPEEYDLSISIYSNETDYLLCDHFTSLLQQFNSTFDTVEQMKKDGLPISSADSISSINRFTSYSLERFFKRPQYLQVKFGLDSQVVGQNYRLVSLFQGDLRELPLIDVEDSNGVYGMNYYSSAAELCFENNLYLLIYEDTRGVGSVLLYRDIRPVFAVEVPYESLEVLQNHVTLYRNRRSDIGG